MAIADMWKIAGVGSRLGVYHVSGVEAECRTSGEQWGTERKSFPFSGSVRAGRMAVSRVLRQGAVTKQDRLEGLLRLRCRLQDASEARAF